MPHDTETVSVEYTDDLMCIRHVRPRPDGSDRGGVLWLSLTGVPWLTTQLRAVVDSWQREDAEAAFPPDALFVIIRGSDAFPRVMIQNERAQDAPHGGIYSIALDAACATALLAQLSP